MRTGVLCHYPFLHFIVHESAEEGVECLENCRSSDVVHALRAKRISILKWSSNLIQFSFTWWATLTSQHGAIFTANAIGIPMKWSTENPSRSKIRTTPDVNICSSSSNTTFHTMKLTLCTSSGRIFIGSWAAMRMTITFRPRWSCPGSGRFPLNCRCSSKRLPRNKRKISYP